MKLIRSDTRSGLRIPGAALAHCGLREETVLPIQLLHNGALLTKNTMSVMELLDLLNDLAEYSESLVSCLEDACGLCDEVCLADCIPESTMAEAENHLREVPPPVLQFLKARGVCLGGLCAHLMAGNAVYGG